MRLTAESTAIARAGRTGEESQDHRPPAALPTAPVHALSTLVSAEHMHQCRQLATPLSLLAHCSSMLSLQQSCGGNLR